LVPALVVAGTFGFLQVAARGVDHANGQGGPLKVILPILVRLVMAAVVIFLFGALGGLGLLGGEQINILADNIRPEDPNLLTIVADGVAAIGNLLVVIGELVELFITPLAAVVGGFVLSGIATDLLAPVLRVMPRLVSHVTGGVLGAVASAILFYILGVLGTWAALLGLLAPITAALLGGQFVVMVYRFVVPRDLRKRRYEPNRIDDSVRLILFAAGAVIAFFIVFFYLNTRIALVNGILPSENQIEVFGFAIRRYIWDNIVVGFVLGALAGTASGVQTPFALGSTLYNVSRTILNTIRSIEPLIMGLVFVIWVGIGPFAGVLALTLHSIAALGKLYSEQVENIDPGPVEALDSTGANRVQTIAYAVVPQIIPPYIAFTMYRWDINVRMSTIIGFVGGGGIGLLLQQQINLLRYRDAGVAVLAIAVVVSILDYASAWIRARIM
jgi:phosphonate transport system permease protein